MGNNRQVVGYIRESIIPANHSIKLLRKTARLTCQILNAVVIGRKENTMLDFGDYCTIEQKRYGCKNEFFQYKVIGNFSSNCYREVPVDGANTKHKHAREMHDVLNVICCGVDETKVEKVRVCDVVEGYDGDFAL